MQMCKQFTHGSENSNLYLTYIEQWPQNLLAVINIKYKTMENPSYINNKQLILLTDINRSVYSLLTDINQSEYIS